MQRLRDSSIEGGEVVTDVRDRSAYHFKRHAIQNCLYGVDIDPGAVEIAKLRLWLSLVVDEDDMKQIKPLPNLDYKVVTGNSLLGVETNLLNVDLFKRLEALKPLCSANITSELSVRVSLAKILRSDKGGSPVVRKKFRPTESART